MSVIVTCACGQQFATQERHLGKRVACPMCGGPITIGNAMPPPPPLVSPLLPVESLPPAAPLHLPPASDDATEKLAFRLAYLAAGSVGLLAVAIVLTSLFHNIAHVWTSQPTVAAARALTPASLPTNPPAAKLPAVLPSQTPESEGARDARPFSAANKPDFSALARISHCA